MPGVVPFQLDVTSETSVRRSVQTVRPHTRTAARVTLVNNAGIMRSGLLDASPFVQDLEACLAVNAVGPARMTVAHLPEIRRTGGRVVNVSSAVSLFAASGLGAYCGSKFAVDGMSDAMRRDLRVTGVELVKVVPGTMRTGLFDYMMSDAAIDRAWAATGEDARAIYGRQYLEALSDRANVMVKLLGSDPELVVEALHRAVVSRWPQAIMRVGLDVYLAFWPSSLMPCCISDWAWGLLSPPLPLPGASR